MATIDMTVHPSIRSECPRLQSRRAKRSHCVAKIRLLCAASVQQARTLAPTPWQSGSVDREQGVSKTGNPRLRTTLIQLAWLWLRHQPQSALALWFEERVRRNGGRLKKTTIVALARKLLVALWKYVTAGVVIEGAVMKRT